jgi:hypothetical protein
MSNSLHRRNGDEKGDRFSEMGKRDRLLPKQKKPGFLHNLCLYTDILCKNPVSEPPGGLGGAIAMYATSDKSIGKVLTTLTVTNRADQSAATRGFIPTEQIRSITLDNVLVEQGATTLSLPEGAIAIPSKTKQPIAIGLSFSFLTKGDLSPQLNIGPIALLVTNVFAGKRDRPSSIPEAKPAIAPLE